MSENEIVNPFGEPLFLPASFQHPNRGKWKDMPEAWWTGKKCRVLVECVVDQLEQLVPAWVDFLRFEDQVICGSPQRVAVGRLEGRAWRADKALPAGSEIPFAPEEVVDVVEDPRLPDLGGVFFPFPV